MRYSTQVPVEPATPVAVTASNQQFFKAVTQQIGEGELAGAILLVGGIDERSLAVRRAQAVLRYDRLVSYWSHAALLISSTRGLEVALTPESEFLQRPGRNGVTVFAVDRYFDGTRYPNLGVFCFEFPADSQTRRTIVEAALDPNRERMRYPFWDQLASWARYAYSPDLTPNPLAEGVALPGAAFCEYAYGAANVDLTPGATGNHACPELLWATMKRWAPQLDAMESIRVRSFTVLRDPVGTPAPPPPNLTSELGIDRSSRSPRGAAKARSKKKRA
jgi:hypothetical protein